MKKLLVAIAGTMMLGSSFARADDQARPVATAPKPVLVSPSKQTSKAVRLTDAQLDNVVAGSVISIHTGSLTLIINPGNADVSHTNHNRTVIITSF